VNKAPENQVPAVVVGVDVNGLGVVRSLARAGVPVIAVDTDLDKPTMRTRYGRKVRVASLAGEPLVQALIELAEGLAARPVLFITEEASVRTVSEQRAALTPFYRFRMPQPDVLDALMHKEPFQRLAERHGFRVPKSLHIVDEASLAAAAGLPFPAILKPGKKDAGYGRAFKKAYRVENFEEVSTLCRQIMPVLPDLVLQEWIVGEDSDIYFCLQYVAADGRAVASFTGRKIRSWPPNVGGTASCLPAPEAAAVLSAETTRFFEATGFAGMGSMEYKRDARSGEFVLVEPTVGRTDYQEEVATLNGVNIPLAAYCAELGLPFQPRETAAKPAVWRETWTDRQSAELQGQKYGKGPLDSGRCIDAYWRLDDPAPWLNRVGDRLLKAGGRRLKRHRTAPVTEGRL
jgi:predicted ATP-grasp superfamily ATP-dependent carboligase